ncbi:MAG: GGDEF domain-containing protein [Hungatella sp.]|nr:GGDEF domain-containing protein [Hungatella sp.]
MEKEKGGKIKGIKIRTINYAMIIAAAVLYVVLVYATVQASIKYKRLIEATEDYILCEKDAALVREGSDYLTEQVRLYVVTLEPEYMEAYFTEKNVTRRREQALEELEEYETSQETYDYLQRALDNSNKLTEREIYAMRLITLAQGYDEASLPEEMKGVVLQEADKNLSSQEMVDRARSMVFDYGYRNAKELIMSNTDYFLDSIIKWTRNKQSESAMVLQNIMNRQRECVVVLFVLNAANFILVIMLIIKPLQVYIDCIKEEKRLEITGAYEFKYLALTYNDIYEVNAANEVLLRHKAEHDPLTGVINRGAFEQMREVLKASTEPLAFLIIDVDKFKLINDCYGHEIGDQILKKVAKHLSDTFRAQDYVARIGGDEFAVIMTNSTRELQPVIQNKVESMNQFLKKPDDGLPPISLSIGIAFSDKGFPEELYSQADRALYQVKENGRCGCHFYDE